MVAYRRKGAYRSSRFIKRLVYVRESRILKGMKLRLLTLSFLSGSLLLHSLSADAESFTDSEDAAKRIISPGKLTDEEREMLALERAIKDLKSDDYMVVEKAIYRFEHMGDRGIRVLINILKDKDADERQQINAAYGLGRIGSRAEQAIPVLIHAAKDSSDDMQAVVASALGKMRVRNSEVINALKKLLENDSQWVTDTTIRALEDIGGRNALKAIDDYKKQVSSR